MRKNETHETTSHHLSGRLHHQKKKKKTTRIRDNNEKMTTREEDSLILPLMVLLSAELMVDCFCCVSRGVRGACYKKKLSIFSKKEQNTHKLETLNIFFLTGSKTTSSFLPSALLFSIAKRTLLKMSLNEKKRRRSVLIDDTQSRVWNNGRGFLL